MSKERIEIEGVAMANFTPETMSDAWMMAARRGVAAALALGALLVLTPAAGAQVEQAEVEVEGMSCPFCAFGLEKRLRKVDGVDRVEVHLEAGMAVLSAVAGGSIVLAAIPEAVERAGFTPGEVRATVVGTVSEAGALSDAGTLSDAGAKAGESDGKRLTTGDGQVILLVNLGEDLRARLSAAEKSKTEVRVRGAIHFHNDQPPGLEPREVDVVDASAGSDA